MLTCGSTIISESRSGLPISSNGFQLNSILVNCLYGLPSTTNSASYIEIALFFLSVFESPVRICQISKLLRSTFFGCIRLGALCVGERMFWGGISIHSQSHSPQFLHLSTHRT